MKNLIILKIGGSVLTNRNKPFTPNRRNLKRIAEEIAEAYDPKKMSLILIHGAGSFGHHMVSRSGIDKGISNKKQLVDFGETNVWQNKWNAVVCGYLQKEGLPAIPYLACSAVMKSGNLFWMPVEAIRELLKIGMIPVLYGIAGVDTDKGSSILSGDIILSWLAKEFLPTRIIHGTDVDGVHTRDPKKYKKAELVREIRLNEWNELKNYLSGSKSVDVTGGMFNKVYRLLDIAKLGITCEIVNANKKGYIEKALKGKKGLGTIVRPR